MSGRAESLLEIDEDRNFDFARHFHRQLQELARRLNAEIRHAPAGRPLKGLQRGNVEAGAFDDFRR
jgi:hypothetical protein